MRKALISAFIVLGVVTQGAQNVGVGYIGDRFGTEGVGAAAAQGVDRVRWLIENYGFYTGTNTYWRMFSPVHKYDWWWRVVATDPDGRDRELPAPTSKATDASSLLHDFREAKLLLNIWTRPPMQAAYIDHRCRDEARIGRKPSSIRLELWWREILPPDKARATGGHRDSAVNSQLMAWRACS